MTLNDRRTFADALNIHRSDALKTADLVLVTSKFMRILKVDNCNFNIFMCIGCTIRGKGGYN